MDVHLLKPAPRVSACPISTAPLTPNIICFWNNEYNFETLTFNFNKWSLILLQS